MYLRNACAAALLALAALVVPTSASAASIQFVFNCQITIATNPDSCVAGGPYGTMTLTDSVVDPNRVDLNFAGIAQPGYGDRLEQFYLNFVTPFLTNHQFYLVSQTAPVGGTSANPYAGYLLGSTQYTNNNSSFHQFRFDVNPDPTGTSLTFAGSLGLYDEIPGPGSPVNIDVENFLLTTAGPGRPALYAGYRTHNGPTGGEFWAGSTLVQNPTPVPEPTSMVLVGSGLLGLVVRRRARARSSRA
jgi:hypothetical protein